jgi:hypothetical protein
MTDEGKSQTNHQKRAGSPDPNKPSETTAYISATLDC